MFASLACLVAMIWCFSEITAHGPTTQQLLIVATLAGTLGSLTRVLGSIAIYAGSGKMTSRWLPWYVLSPFQGGALGLGTTFVLKGGFLPNTVPEQSTHSLKEAYVFGAVAFLAGLFAELTMKKLQDVMYALFGPPQKLPDSLNNANDSAVSSLERKAKIIGECQKHIALCDQGDGGPFFISVATGLGIKGLTPGQTGDAILKQLASSSADWTRLENPDAGKTIQSHAEEGRFIVGGIPAGDNNGVGKLFVVVANDAYRLVDSPPVVYGKTGATSIPNTIPVGKLQLFMWNSK